MHIPKIVSTHNYDAGKLQPKAAPVGTPAELDALAKRAAASPFLSTRAVAPKPL